MRKIYIEKERKEECLLGNSVTDDDNIGLQPKGSNFHVFIGYRFKAPKQIAKPIDLLEEKIPILKEDN